MKLFLGVLTFVLSGIVNSQNIDQTKCGNNQGLELLFLNGIRNEVPEAKRSRNQIESLIADSSNSPTRISPNGLDDICYKYIYNQTEEYLDLIEVYAQKIREADPLQSENQVYQKVSKLLILKEIPSLAEEEIDGLAELAEIEAEHFARTEYHTLHVETAPIVIKDLKERSVLVVSHSQGNLFANLIVVKNRES